MKGSAQAGWVVGMLLLATVSPCQAATIGDLVETDAWEQMARFFSLRDAAVRTALAGSLLLGLTCGVLGCFIVVRRMALVGDALAHTVLPGVVLGFLWNMTKDPVAIMAGAAMSGLIGVFTVEAITKTTKLKEDAALGIVLATFFAAGICLLSMIQGLPTAGKAGLEKFLFGQAAAMSEGDVMVMAGLAVVVLAGVFVLYKELMASSFDPDFSRGAGLPAGAIAVMLMVLLTATIVIAIQAVGVVLVSAMLITPAAAAYLLTDRLHRMIVLAAIFGMVSGASGAFFSFLGTRLPTGPFMVLMASAIFAAAFWFSPQHGVAAKWWMQWKRQRRIDRENTLKSIYHVLEERGFEGDSVSLGALAERRREALEDTLRRVRALERNRLATFDEPTNRVTLSLAGWQRACEVVRNHRLWELYLTHAAHYPADHVHEDAERMEHLLGEEIVEALERRLEHPRLDPHGRKIPSAADIQRARG